MEEFKPNNISITTTQQRKQLNLKAAEFNPNQSLQPKSLPNQFLVKEQKQKAKEEQFLWQHIQQSVKDKKKKKKKANKQQISQDQLFVLQNLDTHQITWDYPTYNPKEIDYLKTLKQKQDAEIRQFEKNIKRKQEAQKLQKQRKQALKYEKFRHLHRINRIVYQLKIKRGESMPKKKNQYKAVPKGTLDFDLELKKKKPSHIRISQQNFRKLQENNDSDYVTEDEVVISSTAPDSQPKQIPEASLQNTNFSAYQEQYKKPPFNQTPVRQYNNYKQISWVNHDPSLELENQALMLINQLALIQRMKKLKEPGKFQQRIVSGFRETIKSINRNQSKLVIMALNIEENPLEMGSDWHSLKVIELCNQQQIPLIHTSTRRTLSRAYTGSFKCKISIVSIINYEGRNSEFQTLLQLFAQLKLSFTKRMQNIIESEQSILHQFKIMPNSCVDDSEPKEFLSN